MSAESSQSMRMKIRLSPGITENRGIKHEKSWKISNITSTPYKPTPYAPLTPLVTSVKGKTEALPMQEIQYTVTGYNQDVSPEDRKRVKWIVEVDGKKETCKEQGETLKLKIEYEWENKEIIVMPYLKTPTHRVSVKTKVKIEGVIIFVNGYWNTGGTAEKEISKVSEKLGKKIKQIIADNMGDLAKKGYWGKGFTEKSIEYFKHKYEDWCGKPIEKFQSIFVDGANIFNSSGMVRFQAGLNEANSTSFQKELKDNGIINDSGKQMKHIFVVSHSMGAAHAEGMIVHLLAQRLTIEWVLHFAPADNYDFQVSIPRVTYQINIMPDPVLLIKNSDDVIKTGVKNTWDKIKETVGQKQQTGKPKPHPYQITNLLPNHFIFHYNKIDRYNHAYSKQTKVWDIVDFLKE